MAEQHVNATLAVWTAIRAAQDRARRAAWTAGLLTGAALGGAASAAILWALAL